MKEILYINRIILFVAVLGMVLLSSVIVFHQQINRFLDGHVLTQSVEEQRTREEEVKLGSFGESNLSRPAVERG